MDKTREDAVRVAVRCWGALHDLSNTIEELPFPVDCDFTYLNDQRVDKHTITCQKIEEHLIDLENLLEDLKRIRSRMYT